MSRRTKRTAVGEDGDESGYADPSSPVAAGRIEAVGDSAISSLFKSVVKIFTSYTRPNYSQPWAMRAQTKCTASGFMISGRRILTNAHAIAYHTSVQVRKHGFAEKFTARVLAIAHDCDIAILTVDDAKFWSGVTPAEFGLVPQLHDQVIVVGYPVGGDQISVTAGVVSRIDFGQYSHSTREHLVIQVDSAINSGNSGGPVFSGGVVVGIAFQSLDQAELVGFIIPTPVIHRVLKDYARNKSASNFGRLGFHYQTLENVHLKAALKLPADAGGVLVTKVVAVSALHGVVKDFDVVSAIDGHEIAEDGTVAFRGDERIAFGHLLTSKFLGDDVNLTVFREGKRMNVSVLVEDVPDLVPKTLYDRRPSYIMHAGLVFTPLSEPYLACTFGREWEVRAPIKLVHMAWHSDVETPNQQVVLLSAILSHPLNVGYDPEELAGLPLVSVDEVKINCMLDVVHAIRAAKGKFIRFLFGESKVIFLPREESLGANKDVMSQHAISAPVSEDLVEALALEEGKGVSSSSSSSGSIGGGAACGAGAMPTATGGRNAIEQVIEPKLSTITARPAASRSKAALLLSAGPSDGTTATGKATGSITEATSSGKGRIPAVATGPGVAGIKRKRGKETVD